MEGTLFGSSTAPQMLNLLPLQLVHFSIGQGRKKNEKEKDKTAKERKMILRYIIRII